MILHYQIGAMTVRIPVKKLVLLWVQNVIPDQEICNLTRDWNNGIALCALVEALRPGSCPQYYELQPQDNVENCRLGIKLAHEHLGIPEVIAAEQMADASIDEQSMMTYLSYFIQDDGVGQDHAKEVISTWSSEITFSNFSTDWNDGIRLCTLVETIKPGTIPHYRELDPNNKVENVKLGMTKAEDELGVKQLFKPEDMTNPEISEIAVMAYLMQFRAVATPVVSRPTPMRIVSIKEEDREEEPAVVIEVGTVNSAPIEEEVIEVVEETVEEEVHVDTEIFVESLPEPEPKVTADMFIISGTGLTDPQIDIKNEFYIRCEEDFNEDLLAIAVTGPGLNAGDDDRIMPIEIEKTNNQLVTCRYPLDTPGLYTIDVTYEGEHLNRSPICIKIVQDLTRVTVSGSGLSEVFINEPAEITLETGLENAKIHAYSVSPSMEEAPAQVVSQGDGVFLIKYVPKQTGLYGLYININGENLPGCPYVARVVDVDSVVVTSSQLKEGKSFLSICLYVQSKLSKQ